MSHRNCEHVLCSKCFERSRKVFKKWKCEVCKKSYTSSQFQKDKDRLTFVYETAHNCRKEVQEVYNRVEPEYNPKKEDRKAFRGRRLEYERYVEEREGIIYDLCFGQAAEKVRARERLKKYRKDNQHEIDKNKGKRDDAVKKEKELNEKKEREKLEIELAKRKAHVEKRQKERALKEKAGRMIVDGQADSWKKAFKDIKGREKKERLQRFADMTDEQMRAYLSKNVNGHRSSKPQSTRERVRKARRAGGWTEGLVRRRFAEEFRSATRGMRRGVSRES
eukprot:g1004.t1